MQKLKLGIVMAAAMAIATTAFASKYVYPWYVNPTLRFRVDNGISAGITPCSVNAGVGGYMAMANEASGELNMRVITADSVLARDTATEYKYGAESDNYPQGGIIVANNKIRRSPNGKSTDYGLGSAPLVAVDGKNVRLLAVNADFSAARLFNAKREKWGVEGKANAPAVVAIEGAGETASDLAFGSDGTALYSNHAIGSNRGKLTKWTLAGTSMVKGSDIDTGLSTVNGFGVYSIDGVEYAAVGEGDGSAETAGQIKLVKLSDGTVTTLINDTANLTSGIKAVRMSHADFFRPRVYALLDTGDVVCYYYSKENSTCHWTATFSNSEMLKFANAPWTKDHAKISDFTVSADGSVALVGYKCTDSTSAAEGNKPTFAFLYHTATPWTYYAAGAEGNPSTTNGACITDGKWVLNMLAGKTHCIGTSSYESDSGNAYDGDYMGEYLDLSAGKATDSANAKTTYNLTDCLTWSLGAKNSTGPRVLIRSSKFNNSAQFTKGWWNVDGCYEEIVMEDSTHTYWNQWANLNQYNKFIVLNLQSLGQMKNFGIYGTTGIYWGEKTSFNNFVFPSLFEIGNRAIEYCLGSGTMELPKIQTLGERAFFSCYNMEELKLSENNNTLTSVGNRAFGVADDVTGHLKRVVLGCASGCTFANQVFYKQLQLEEVVFTGYMPTISGSSGWDRWSDEKEKQWTFVVPNNDYWNNIIKGKYTLLTEAERQAFHLAHPGRYVPFGVLTADALGSNCKQYVAYLDDKGYCDFKLDKDDFFDDEVEIVSDHEVASDGSYLKGTKLTLTAKNGTTGTFRKWYGGPFKDNDEARKATVTITLDEDTCWLYCRFVHPWTLNGAKNKISNGNFTVNCTVSGTSNLNLGISKAHGFYADDDTGYGVCDLGGEVKLEGGDESYTITGWNPTGTMMCGELSGKGNAQTLIWAETTTSFPWGQFLHANMGGNCTGRSLETWIIDAPNMSGTISSGWLTCGNYYLDHVIFQAPKLSWIANDANFWNVPFNETKFDWWNLSGVDEIVGRGACGWDWSHLFGNARGNLELPALRYTNDSKGNYESLARIFNLESAKLGGKTKKTTFTDLYKQTFYGDKSLKKVTIYNDAAMTVGDKPFNGCNSLKEVWLQGKALTNATAMANLFSSVTAATTKPIKLYVSKYMGWSTSLSYIDVATDDEKAEAPDEEVIGVVRAGAESPNGKALVIHRDGPYDPQPMMMLFK